MKHFPNTLHTLQLLVSCLLFATLPYASLGQSKDEAAVGKLLATQASAWNEGKIDAFMNGYWQNDSLVFIGKNGATYGYSTTLSNYKKSYPDTAAMGKLTFDLLQLKKLSSKYFFVIGKWNLQRTIGDLHGSFTLLLQKIEDEWVIIADHSS